MVGIALGGAGWCFLNSRSELSRSANFFNLMHSFKCEENAPCSEIHFVEIAHEIGQKQHDLCN